MAGKSGVVVNNHMVRVFCPKSGEMAWANATKESRGGGVYRCTKCGELHRKP